MDASVQMLSILSIALTAATLVVAVILLVRKSQALDLAPLVARFDIVDRAQERHERTIREEQVASRSEYAADSKRLREELLGAVQTSSETLVRQLGALGGVQNEQLSAFSAQIAGLSEQNERKLAEIRTTVDARLKSLQDDNSLKLDQMRATVDEKLQSTLERRLGESFRLVSDQLEQVHRGLGEMQTLATGVGDLKKVLTNVKSRGTWGEVQLAAILEQILSPQQYQSNVNTKGDGREVVEYAIRFPGNGDNPADPLWLPIDSKFPVEDYLRLQEAQEACDVAKIEIFGRQLETQVRNCAKAICEKYIAPPKTTDFAIMFLPTEGLYSEVIRRTALTEVIQRECRVVVAGPITLVAILNSLRMGFRTLAIQKRSSEVWAVLGSVKTEFGKFGEVLDKVGKKLQEATNVVGTASVRTRAIERHLRDVEALPVSEDLLGGLAAVPSDLPVLAGSSESTTSVSESE